MVELKKLQKKIYQNKVNKGFNITDVPLELCLIQGELAELFEAWKNDKNNIGEELADVFIYLLGLAEILDIDVEQEILKKVEINERRVYKRVENHLEKDDAD